jgi:monofunctional glycosyltransferase
MSQNRPRNPQPEVVQEAKTPWWKRLFAKPEAELSLKQRIIRWFWKIITYFVLGSVALVFVLKFLPIWFTPTMIDRKFSAMSEGKDSALYYEWTPYEDISKEAGLAVVAAEDQLFPQHFGFDFEAMWGAFRHNLKGRRIKGASTISQQVAKNVFLWQGRSYFRKILEVWFTLLIEIIWGKERILEVYLNVAETGKMTFGVEAAAKKNFGVSASGLGREQAARIAAVLPSPRRFSIARPSAYVQRRVNFITRQMRGLGGKAYLSDL